MKRKTYMVSVILIMVLSIIGCGTSKSQSTTNSNVQPTVNTTTQESHSTGINPEDFYANMTDVKFSELTEGEIAEFHNSGYYYKDLWEIYILDDEIGESETYPIIWTDVDIKEFPTIENVSNTYSEILKQYEAKEEEFTLSFEGFNDVKIKIPVIPQEMMTEETYNYLSLNDDETIYSASLLIDDSVYFKLSIAELWPVYDITVCKELWNVSEIFCERTPSYKVVYYYMNYPENINKEVHCHVIVNTGTEKNVVDIEIRGLNHSEVDVQQAVHYAINKLLVL